MRINANATEVSNIDEFVNAVKNSEDIILTDDITTPSDYTRTLTYGNYNIDGNHYTIYGKDQTTQFLRIMGGTIDEIKNITFDGFVNQIIPQDENGNPQDPDDNQGAAIINMSKISHIENTTFKNNSSANGGAIDNGYNAYIGHINAKFISNKATGHGESSGAAIFNQGHIANIEGYFEDNFASLHGAIWNHGTIDNITATFYKNHRSAVGATNGKVTITNSLFLENDSTGIDGVGQSGGAIHFYGGAKFYIKGTTFDKNSVWWKGGAIAAYGNQGNVLNIEDSIFTNNYAGEEGGAIYYNSAVGSTASVKNSTFTQNHGNRSGGAIHNGKATFDITNSTFDGNSSPWSGAIHNGGIMTITDSSLINNKATSGNAGGIQNTGSLTIKNTSFETNTTKGNGGALGNTNTIDIDNATINKNQATLGGGIYSQGDTATTTISNSTITNNTSTSTGGAIHVESGALTIINSIITDNQSGSGGAIHSLTDITLKADNGTLKIANNNTQTNNTAIFMAQKDTTINLNTTNNGLIEIEDIIDGDNYNISISGDLTNYDHITLENIQNIAQVDFKNSINNLNTLTLDKGGVLSLDKTETITTTNYIGNNGTLLLKTEMDKTTNTLTNGLINVSNDVSGHSNVIIDFLKDDTTSSPTDVFSPFLLAQNDDTSTSATFNVAAVIGSPYAWVAKYNIKGNETGSTWYLAVQTQQEPELPENPTEPETPDNTETPPPSTIPETPEASTPSQSTNPIYRAEIPAYIGVIRTAIEQNKNISSSVERGLNFKKNANCQKGKCRIKQILPEKTAWIDISHEKSKIESPTEIDAKINGTTLGIDIHRTHKQRIGLFGSYRNGTYDFSGQGYLLSTVGSEIKTDSVLGGAYYRYDNNNWLMLATIFAGKQDINITTNDNLIDTSTSAKQYGASFELAKKLTISQHLDLEPSLSLYYTYLDFDKINDSLGKSVYFDSTTYLEAELGLKLEYLYCRNGCSNSFYVKPSIIKTFSKNAKTKISSLDSIKAYEDEVLGRVELGTIFGIANNLSGYATNRYTFGSDYKSYDINLGLNYKF